MDETELARHPAFREVRQPGAGRFADALPRPFHRRPGVRVEPVDVDQADGGGVVIAADSDRAELAQPIDDSVWFRAVADDVAEMPDGVDRPKRRDDRIERDEIGVNVREDGDAHSRQPSSRRSVESGRPRWGNLRPSPRLPTAGRGVPGKGSGGPAVL